MTTQTQEKVTTPIRVGVLDAQGRMGSNVCQAVKEDPALELVVAVDNPGEWCLIESAKPDVVVDFTVPAATQENVRKLVALGINVVVGTTGWDEEAIAKVEAQVSAHNATASNQVGVLIVPNFSLSAVFTMKFATQAAKFFESVEIIELHHPQKLDAPSGTASHTAKAVSEVREAANIASSPDATESGFEARGALVGQVRVHAVRLAGLVAHEEVLLGNPGEQLVIRQDSFDRKSFMPGVVMSIKKISQYPGVNVGLDTVLEF